MFGWRTAFIFLQKKSRGRGMRAPRRSLSGLNMRLGSGIAKVTELQAAGSPVGLAVDGSASNDASSNISGRRNTSGSLLARLARGADSMTVLMRSVLPRLAARPAWVAAIWELYNLAKRRTLLSLPSMILAIPVQAIRSAHCYSASRLAWIP